MNGETKDGKAAVVDEDTLEAYAALLELHGYKVRRPAREVSDEYTFERAWDLYEKKVGGREKLKRTWNRMSKRDRRAATESIPAYVMSTPDKRYRLNFQTYLNQRRWDDELMTEKPEEKAEEKTDIEKMLEDNAPVDETERRREKRRRILGMIEAARANPRSLVNGALRGMHANGLLKELGIEWEPQTAG